MVFTMSPASGRDESDPPDGHLDPPHGYQDIVGDGWTCTACGVTIPRNPVLTKHHQAWHRELERRLMTRDQS